MPSSRMIGSSLWLSLSCLSLGALFARPAQDAIPSDPRPDERPVVTTAQPRLVEPRLAQLTDTMRSHLVRVRVFTEFEVRRVDGLLISKHRLDYGLCGGLVVSDDPLVMISDSACRRDIAGIDLPAKDELDPARRKFEILLDDGAVIAARVVHSDSTLNVLLLRPDDPARWPADKAAIGALGPAPTVEQHVGIVGYANAEISPQLRVFEESILPKSAGYERPALVRSGLSMLGLPVCDADLRLVGIVNIPPPSEPYPRATLNFPAANPPPRRDPGEWESGVRKPLLIPAARLAPLLEGLSRAPRPVEFAPLGMSLADRDGRILVLKVFAGGVASRAGLVSGDVLVKCAEAPLATVEDFSQVLERAVAGGATEISLSAVRGAESRDVLLPLP